MGCQAGSTRKARRIKLPRYVKSYVDHTGKPRFYFRRGDAPLVPLPFLPWSTEFMEAYSRALDTWSTPAPVVLGASRTKQGTVNAAIVSYYVSEEFTEGLAKNTQDWRRRCLEKFRAEFGDLTLRKIERRHVQRYMGALVKASQQRNMGQTLGHFFEYCATAGLIGENVAEGVKRKKMKPSKGFNAWTEDHVDAFTKRHPIGSKAYLALMLYLNLGVRKSDVVRVGPEHINEAGELENFQPQKTSRTGGHTINVPLLDETKAAIAATPVTGVGTFLVTEFGKAFTAKGFGNKMRDWCDQAGLPKGVDGVASHGLRKLCLIRLAELGLSTDLIMAISGHKNRAEVDTYVAAANRKKMARQAMEAVANARNARANERTKAETELSNRVVQLDKKRK